MINFYPTTSSLALARLTMHRYDGYSAGVAVLLFIGLFLLFEVFF